MTARAENRAVQEEYFAHIQDWPTGKESTLQNGQSFAAKRIYAFTVLMSDYPETARTFLHYHRGVVKGASYRFMAFMLFLMCVEYSALQMQIVLPNLANIPQRGGRAPRGRGRPFAPFRPGRHGAMSVADEAAQLEADLNELMNGVSDAESVAGGDADFLDAELARDLREAGINVEPEFVNGTGRQSYRSLLENNRMIILLEEVPHRQQRGSRDEPFPEMYAVEEIKHPACYTFWVLLGQDIDWLVPMRRMLAENILHQRTGRDYVVTLSKKQKDILYGIADAGVTNGLNIAAVDEDDDIEAEDEEDDGEEAEDQGDQRGHMENRQRRGGAKRTAANRSTRRSNAVKCKPWESFKNINWENIYRMLDSYTGDTEGIGYYIHAKNTGTNIADDNPIHPKHWFSPARAIRSRGIDCSDRQGIVYYEQVHVSRSYQSTNVDEMPPYVPPNATFSNEMNIFRVPYGCESRFIRINDLDIVRGASVCYRRFVHIQAVKHPLPAVYPTLFGLRNTDDSTNAIVATWASSGGADIDREVGPIVEDPEIAGKIVSCAQLQVLYDLARDHDQADLVRMADDTETRYTQTLRQISQLTLESSATNRRLLQTPATSAENSRAGTVNQSSGEVRLDVNGILGSGVIPAAFFSSSSSSSSSSSASSARDNSTNSRALSRSATPSFGSSSTSGSGMDQAPWHYSPLNPSMSRRNAPPLDATSYFDSNSMTFQSLIQDESYATDQTMILRSRAEKFRDELDLLRMVVRKPVRDEIREQYEKYHEGLRRQEQWRASNRSLRLHQNRFMPVDEDYSFTAFDPRSLTTTSAPYELLALIDAHEKATNRAQTISHLQTVNGKFLEKMRNLFYHCNVPPKTRACLYMLYKRAAINIYATNCRSSTADVPAALRVIYNNINRSDLYSRRSRQLIYNVDYELSSGENLLLTQLEMINVVFCIAVPIITLMGWWFGLCATMYKFCLHMNLLLAGPAAASKTHPLMLLTKLRCHMDSNTDKDMTTIQVTRATDRATSVDNGGESNFFVKILNEASKMAFECKDEGGTGDTTLKQLLDQCLSQVTCPIFQKDSTESGTFLRVSEQVGVLIAAINWSPHTLDDAILGRFVVMMARAPKNPTSTINDAQIREMNLTPRDLIEQQNAIRLFNTFHAATAEIDMLIATNCIEDVGTWLVGFVMQHINANLKKDGLPAISARMTMNIRTGARTLAIQRALCHFFVPGGVFTSRDITPQNLGLLEPYLYVLPDDLIPCLGMLAPYCTIQGEDDVRLGIELYMNSIADKYNTMDAAYRKAYGVAEAHSNNPNEEEQNNQNNNQVDLLALLGDNGNSRQSENSNDFGLLANADHRMEDSNGNAMANSSVGGFLAHGLSNIHAANAVFHESGYPGFASDGAPRFARKQYVYDFNFVSIRMPVKFVDPLISIAELLLPFMTHDDRITTNYTVNCIATVLKRLQKMSIVAPEYVKIANSRNRMEGPTMNPLKKITTNVLTRDNNYVYISTHWMHMRDKGTLDVIESTLKDVFGSRHQAKKKYLFAPDPDSPHTFRTIELGNDNPDDPRLPQVIWNNANYLPDDEYDFLYEYNQNAAKDHDWKKDKHMLIDSSLPSFAATHHNKKIHGYHGKITERDLAKVLYSCEHLFKCTDTASKYSKKEFSEVDFSMYDDKRRMDFPDECFQVSDPLDPENTKHHANLVFGDGEQSKEAYFQDGFFTTSDVVDHIAALQHVALAHRSRKYPDIFKERYSSEVEERLIATTRNMNEAMGAVSEALDELERETLKARSADARKAQSILRQQVRTMHHASARVPRR